MVQAAMRLSRKSSPLANSAQMMRAFLAAIATHARLKPRRAMVPRPSDSSDPCAGPA